MDTAIHAARYATICQQQQAAARGAESRQQWQTQAAHAERRAETACSWAAEMLAVLS